MDSAPENEKVDLPTKIPPDDVLLAAGWIKASRRDRRILSYPRVGQVYWVDFPHDAYAPEFFEEHPCVVIRGATSYHDTCVVVPLTTRPNDQQKHVYKLERNPNTNSRKGHLDSFAVCSHIYTVHLNRLRPILFENGKPNYSKIHGNDLKCIFSGIKKAFPALFDSQPESEIATDAQKVAAPPMTPRHGPSGRVVLTLKGKSSDAPKGS